MSKPTSDIQKLSPELLLRAYAAGIFPMAESRDDQNVFWVDPKVRGILPLNNFHVSRSLRKIVRRGDFTVTCNQAFNSVVENCAVTTHKRQETWINSEIQQAYNELHNRGFAHSMECWRDGDLVGGLYGVSLGGAFFGESMFSLRPNASKVAIVHLVARLRLGGYRLLDTQFVTDHLRQFGVVELSSLEYQERLGAAICYQAIFPQYPDNDIFAEMLARVLDDN
jgi:leucyl/phenylalanyl-tRNA--protein transferase